MLTQLVLTSASQKHAPITIGSLSDLWANVNIGWEALVLAYHDGNMANWLSAIGYSDLAQAIEQVTRSPATVTPGQRNRNLQNFLTLHLGFPDPQIAIEPSQMNWGVIDLADEPPVRSLYLRNNGLGCAYGWVITRRPELHQTQFESFVLPPGESQTRYFVLRSHMLRPAGLHAQEGISIRIRVCRPEQTHDLITHVACHAALANTGNARVLPLPSMPDLDHADDPPNN